MNKNMEFKKYELVIAVLSVFILTSIFSFNVHSAGSVFDKKVNKKTRAGKIELKLGKRAINSVTGNNVGKAKVGSFVENKANGNTTIDVSKIKKVLNEVRGSKNATKLQVGVMSNSHITGNTIIKVKAKNIKNRIMSGDNNKAMLTIGTIENSRIEQGGAKIDVNIMGDVLNTIRGGSKNIAEVRVGSIRNSKIGVRADIILNSRGVENEISNGSSSIAGISMGTVE